MGATIPNSHKNYNQQASLNQCVSVCQRKGYSILQQKPQSDSIAQKWVTHEQQNVIAYISRMKDNSNPYIPKIMSFGDFEEQGQTYWYVAAEFCKPFLEAKKLSKGEICYVLLSVLKGYQLLVKQYDFFHLSLKQIFFNQKGEVKIWVDQNLSINSPKKKYNSQQSEKRIICTIISSILSKREPLPAFQFKLREAINYYQNLKCKQYPKVNYVASMRQKKTWIKKMNKSEQNIENQMKTQSEKSSNGEKTKQKSPKFRKFIGLTTDQSQWNIPQRFSI